MWLSELITEYGIGNGASLLIFQNIVSGIPRHITDYNNFLNIKEINIIFIVSLLFLFMLSLTIIIQEGTKKITIISAKQLNTINKINPKTDSKTPIKITKIKNIRFKKWHINPTINKNISKFNNNSNKLSLLLKNKKKKINKINKQIK